MNRSIPACDAARLERLYDKVIACLRDGDEWTLEQLRVATLGGEASISARIRELRADGFPITKRRAAKGSGLFLYRLERLGKPVQMDFEVRP